MTPSSVLRRFPPCSPSARALLLAGLIGFFPGVLSAAPPEAATGENTPVAVAAQAPENWAVHGQFTHEIQSHPAFTSPYAGANSLIAAKETRETTDITLYAGLRLSDSSEIWINPEEDQGYGLSNTLGLAGFSSGEAYKVGESYPYFRVPRLFYRKVIGLGGAMQKVEPAANQLGGAQAADNVTLTLGKFSIVDLFDTNAYAHDPRADFMNWAVVESGAFDYAADAWGYTVGAALEWTQSDWTLRGGLVELAKTPNNRVLDPNFSQYEAVAELEERYRWSGHPGKLKLLGFVNRGRMGRYADALLANPSNPDTASVRQFASRPGIALNLEQELSSDLGGFVRASLNDGSKEAHDFTEINQSLAAGLSLRGDRLGRPDDTLGAAVAVNALSGDAQAYFAAGGMGILIGDGKLNYGREQILEAYYSLRASDHMKLALDYQHVANPAYNRERGPVAIVGARLHAEF